jgi:nucleotide-binding universal stress UspA family protein
MSLSTEKGLGDIIAAVDESKDSASVVRVASWLASGLKSDLTLLEVVHFGRFRTRMSDSEFKGRIAEAKEKLESAAAPIRKGGLNVSTASIESEDSIVRSITDYASKEGAGLIVLGTRSHGGLEKMVSGSVSSGVASHAGCSVLVVRGVAPKAILKRIIVAVDGSKNAVKAVRVASQLAKMAHAQVTLVHIIHIPSYVYSYGSGESIDRIEKDEKKYGEELLASAAKVAAESGIEVGEELIEDVRSPASRLVRYAESEGADLIVVGARGVTTFERLLLGSVALGVLSYSKIPVLIVR